MTDLSTDLLKQLATGTGRCYNHEGKAMAAEILRWREAAAKAAAATAAAPTSSNHWGMGIP